MTLLSINRNINKNVKYERISNNKVSSQLQKKILKKVPWIFIPVLAFMKTGYSCKIILMRKMFKIYIEYKINTELN